MFSSRSKSWDSHGLTLNDTGYTSRTLSYPRVTPLMHLLLYSPVNHAIWMINSTVQTYQDRYLAMQNLKEGLAQSPRSIAFPRDGG